MTNWFDGRTKGERLLALKNNPKFVENIPPLVLIGVGDGKPSLGDLPGNKGSLFCVRSSFRGEDSETSMAGQYLSILNLEANQIDSAITSVVASKENCSREEHVIVQVMVEKPVLSGVIFTSNPKTGTPQYILEWSEGSETDIVTSGASNVKSVSISDCGGSGKERLPSDLAHFRGLMEICRELETACNSKSLDIEFAKDAEGRWWILQVRPLSGNRQFDRYEGWCSDIHAAAEFVREKQRQASAIGLPKPLFGLMPDWNPAELVGVAPRELSLSLFRYLISDGTWAYERSNFGYFPMRGHPLIVEIQGCPFVDVSVSAQSLVPASIPSGARQRVLDAMLSKLSENPHLHDKVEFEVYVSEWTLTSFERLASLGLDRREARAYDKSLRQLTRSVVLSAPYGLESSLLKSEQLLPRFDLVEKAGLSPLARAFWHLENCRRYGTLPFGGAARAAFMATAILRSLVEQSDGLNDRDLQAFYTNLTTPMDELRTMRQAGRIDNLVSNFGHLRPGTFEITSPSYSRNPELFFGNPPEDKEEEVSKSWDSVRLNLSSKLATSKTLETLGVSAHEFLNFAKRAIEGREWLKFNFSRNISAALDAIEIAGDQYGISLEDISHSDIRTLLEANFTDQFNKSKILDSIARGKDRMTTRQEANLPLLISGPLDITVSRQFESQPNFITKKVITRATASISDGYNQNLENKIVLIPSADPGYDWLFAKGISGLVTEFGGANSHMAIRCNELGIPAAIGVGTRIWSYGAGSSTMTLDCLGRRVTWHN